MALPFCASPTVNWHIHQESACYLRFIQWVLAQITQDHIALDASVPAFIYRDWQPFYAWVHCLESTPPIDLKLPAFSKKWTALVEAWQLLVQFYRSSIESAYAGFMSWLKAAYTQKDSAWTLEACYKKWIIFCETAWEEMQKRDGYFSAVSHLTHCFSSLLYETSGCFLEQPLWLSEWERVVLQSVSFAYELSDV